MLKAHLARQQYHEAMAAYLAWHGIAGKASEQVYLVAQAMGQLGWLSFEDVGCGLAHDKMQAVGCWP